MYFFLYFSYMDRPTAREAIPVEGNPHQGHRRRMLDKFGRLGVDAFADHELLEVLLYYTIRQGDTNPVAHALMQHFGSLHAVLEATADQLCEVEGVGPRTAEYLSLISASMRRYQTDRIRARNSVIWLNDPDKIGAFFIPRFAALHTESLCVAYVDSSCRLIRCDDQSRGSTSKVLLDPVAIPRSAVMCNAAGVVLAHNHPNGEARPSREDIRATQMLVARLAPLDIVLVDHCIVAQDSYYSMVRGGELHLMMHGRRG